MHSDFFPRLCVYSFLFLTSDSYPSTSSTDPQTSGGLLVACAPEAVEEVLRTFREGGFEFAAVVGSLVEGSGLEVD